MPSKREHREYQKQGSLAEGIDLLISVHVGLEGLLIKDWLVDRFVQ